MTSLVELAPRTDDRIVRGLHTLFSQLGYRPGEMFLTKSGVEFSIRHRKADPRLLRLQYLLRPIRRIRMKP